MFHTNITMKLTTTFFLLLAAAVAAKHDIKFVEIPAGEFLMGNTKKLPVDISAGQPNRLFGNFNEAPVIKQIVDDFEMSTTEITNKMYEQFDPEHQKLRGKLHFSKDDDEAVIWVSINNATNYAKWLTKTRNDGYTYRLPTEIEWEYACRAGTTTVYNTGDEFPKSQRKNNGKLSNHNNPEATWPNIEGEASKLHVAMFEPNKFGLYDMHGNVEEFTSTIYKEYSNETERKKYSAAMDTVYVTRGGSHGTALYFLRSATRLGALEFTSNIAIGFRVVREKTKYNKGQDEENLRYNNDDKNVIVTTKTDPAKSFDNRNKTKPYFRYLQYVNIPKTQTKFPYGGHNHDPSITYCPDGSLLAIFFSTWYEKDREQGLASTRLSDTLNGTWSTPVTFFNIPGRVNTAPSFLLLKSGKLMQWMAVSPWESNKGTQVYQRESLDCGVSWSTSQVPPGLDFFGHHSPAETSLELSDGTLLLPTDDSGDLPKPTITNNECNHGLGKNTKTSGQISRFALSKDEGKTWTPQNGTIRGHHGAFVELKNGSIWGIGRNNGIVGEDNLMRMAQAITTDRGETFKYIAATCFPNIVSGQRMIALRLAEGPIIVVSFANGVQTGVPSVFESRTGKEIFGMFVAVSFDEATSFPIIRLVSDDKVSHPVETSDGDIFYMNQTHAEPRGYISAIQDLNTKMIHVISSRQHYQFNYAWLVEK
eukprot:g1033.t1